MAISTGRRKQHGVKVGLAEQLAKQAAEQARRAAKRKKKRGFLGKVLGSGIGMLATGALGIASGGLLAPLVLGASQFAGRKLAHEMTRGDAADASKIKGAKHFKQYGYGEEEEAALKSQVRSMQAVDPFKEKGGLGKDILSSYSSALKSGGLGKFGKGLLKGDVSFGEALTGQTVSDGKGWLGKMKAGEIGGMEGAKESLASQIPGVSYKRPEAPTLAAPTGEIAKINPVEVPGMDMGRLELGEMSGKLDMASTSDLALSASDPTSGMNILDVVNAPMGNTGETSMADMADMAIAAPDPMSGMNILDVVNAPLPTPDKFAGIPFSQEHRDTYDYTFAQGGMVPMNESNVLQSLIQQNISRQDVPQEEMSNFAPPLQQLQAQIEKSKDEKHKCEDCDSGMGGDCEGCNGDSKPTISDFFQMQNKTLSGGSVQSISQRLGG